MPVYDFEHPKSAANFGTWGGSLFEQNFQRQDWTGGKNEIPGPPNHFGGISHNRHISGTLNSHPITANLYYLGGGGVIRPCWKWKQTTDDTKTQRHSSCVFWGVPCASSIRQPCPMGMGDQQTAWARRTTPVQPDTGWERLRQGGWDGWSEEEIIHYGENVHSGADGCRLIRRYRFYYSSKKIQESWFMFMYFFQKMCMSTTCSTIHI